MDMRLCGCRKAYFREMIKSPANLATKWEDIVGREKVKTSLLKATALKASGKHSDKFQSLLLYGAPGAGKGTLVEGLAKFYEYNLLRVGFDNLKANHYLEARDRMIATFEAARESQPCILFLDGVETMLQGCNRSDNAVAFILGCTFRAKTEDVKTLKITNIENGLIVVASTTDPTKLDPGMFWHFESKILVPELSKNERFKVLKTYEEFFGLNALEKKQLLDNTEGFAYADIQNLAEQIRFRKRFRDVTRTDIIDFAEKSIPMLQVNNQTELVPLCRDFIKNLQAEWKNGQDTPESKRKCRACPNV